MTRRGARHTLLELLLGHAPATKLLLQLPEVLMQVPEPLDVLHN